MRHGLDPRTILAHATDFRMGLRFQNSHSAPAARALVVRVAIEARQARMRLAHLSLRWVAADVASRSRPFFGGPLRLLLFSLLFQVAEIAHAPPRARVVVLEQRDAAPAARSALVAFPPMRAVGFRLLRRWEVEGHAELGGDFLAELLRQHRFTPRGHLAVEQPDVAPVLKEQEVIPFVSGVGLQDCGEANVPPIRVAVPHRLDRDWRARNRIYLLLKLFTARKHGSFPNGPGTLNFRVCANEREKEGRGEQEVHFVSNSTKRSRAAFRRSMASRNRLSWSAFPAMRCWQTSRKWSFAASYSCRTTSDWLCWWVKKPEITSAFTIRLSAAAASTRSERTARGSGTGRGKEPTSVSWLHLESPLPDVLLDGLRRLAQEKCPSR
ncbi:hypothetical protein FRUB_10626 [Fimbriiglobus ruber]|uniref:Uncharacterized protein n=1 Tax=Fimbriiglobus ruber TaxID=1908690 RepID=A0A225DE28_9BACT|nr:hypothetical protein FRUB_10626 [Fimbriiglobus ruber]